MMKHINKIKFRRIKVLDENYLWKRGHFHLEAYEDSACVEKVIILLEHHRNAPLQLYFRQEDNKLLKAVKEETYWCVGYPDDGVIWSYHELDQSLDSRYINLNRPAVIATLIQYFIAKDWKPRESRKPYIVEDALKLLEVIEWPMGLGR